MTANLERLKQVMDNRHAYFSSGAQRSIEYVRYSIKPAFLDAVNDVTDTLPSSQHVDPTVTKAVVHYTSLQALFTMLDGGVEPPKLSGGRYSTDQQFLRLYDSANLNDPSEGVYFMKRVLTNTSNPLKTPAYIASFITPRETGTDPIKEARNNLVFWRHYGDDGRGCSITIPADRFTSHQYELKLRTVIYGSTKANAAASQLRLPIAMLEMTEDLDTEIRREVAVAIRDGLGEIPYLYKSSAYMYERECRIVAMESNFEGHGGLCHDFEKRSSKSGRIRIYGRHPLLNLTNILSTGTVITLGPDVPNIEYVEYALEQLLLSLDVRDLPIERSKIPYRRT